MKISGLASTSKFGTVQKKVFTLLSDNGKKGCGSGFLSWRNCPLSGKRNHCTVEYRDYLETTTESIDFSEESEADRLFFKIGDVLYPLEGRGISEDGSVLKVEFEIFPDMAKKGNALFLVPIPEEPERTFRTGLLDYGDCPKDGNFVFYKDDGAKKYFHIEKKIIRKYLLKLEKK